MSTIHLHVQRGADTVLYIIIDYGQHEALQKYPNPLPYDPPPLVSS